MNPKIFLSFFIASFMVLSCTSETDQDKTQITKWQDDKSGAVSITFDDSTINHFRVAIPILNRLSLPGTFYLITGSIPGSENQPRFIGRDVDEIIDETTDVSTNEDNFFERASAIRYLGYRDVHTYHRDAGQLFESGESEAAYEVIDEGYEQVRNGEFEQGEAIDQYLFDVLFVDPDSELITWDEIRELDNGLHEFGSHTVTHPYLAVLDEANMLFELEKSREDIRTHLGEDHTFSVEGPFGTEDERVMEYLFETYPASRNRMPEPFLDELNRSSDQDPADSENEYVQWQRGPLEDTPMDLMKSWVDKTADNKNIWLVLVFHGVEGIGWEPKSEEELEEYYSYIKEHEDDVWVATFKDATQYVRQRMNADVTTEVSGEEITVKLTHTLGDLYNLPMTLKTEIPDSWETVQVSQGEQFQNAEIIQEKGTQFVLYRAIPNAESIQITP